MTTKNVGTVAALSVLAATALLSSGIATAAGRVSHWVLFDAPGAAGGTYPAVVNDLGTVVGAYFDANNNEHGFVRTADGHVTTIDVPGDGNQTEVTDINDLGTMIGDYTDAAGNVHGFIRYPGGRLSTFDDPNAAGFTLPYGINIEGVVAGRYHDSDGNAHGFIRNRDGTLTTIDAPSTATDSIVGTACYHINDEGTILCKSLDSTATFRELERYPDGHSRFIVAPGAGVGQNSGTFGSQEHSLNDLGQITGTFYDSNLGAHAYFLDARNRFTEIDVPGAGTDSATGTYAGGINLLGAIIGFTYEENFTSSRGYVRFRDGTVIPFTAPGAPSTGTYTQPFCINLIGEFTGSYTDLNGISHGFVAIATPY